VLLGTLYPLLLDALNLGKISVGPPYFDTVFVPLMIPVIFLMGVGPMTRWKQAELPDLARRLRWAAVVALVGSLLSGWLAGGIHVMSSIGLALAWWVAASVATDLWEKIRPLPGVATTGQRLRQVQRATVGMMVAHLGVAAFIFGVTMVRTYEVERDVKMKLGETTTVSGYTFTFLGVREVEGPNYVAAQGQVKVTAEGSDKTVVEMYPEKRVYRVQRNPMTEAAITTGLLRDLYVSLGEPVDNNEAWIVRIYVKPFIDWIWGGCLMMALGGALAASDRRYRRGAREAAIAAAATAAASTSGAAA
jgi:cytochrome c-type biogenesis protein CcmF